MINHLPHKFPIFNSRFSPYCGHIRQLPHNLSRVFLRFMFIAGCVSTESSNLKCLNVVTKDSEKDSKTHSIISILWSVCPFSIPLATIS